MKSYYRNTNVGRPYGNVTVFNRGTQLEYKKGKYIFREGVVTFYAENKYAAFEFVYGGIIHSLTLSEFKKPFTDRQLIIRAGKFGRTISMRR